MEKDNQLPVQYLKLISGGEIIVIEPSNGQATIAQAEETFKSFISHNFKKLDLDKPGLATGETLLNVYELTKPATFIQMFDSLSSDRDKLVMSQNQIIIFCQKYIGWLCRGGFSTFFLIKKDEKGPATNDNLFVVYVYVLSGSLDVDVNPLEFEGLWGAEPLRRLVIPQIIPLIS